MSKQAGRQPGGHRRPGHWQAGSQRARYAGRRSCRPARLPEVAFLQGGPARATLRSEERGKLCYRRLRKKHSSGEEDLWKQQLSEHHIRGRTAVSASGLQGKGPHERSVSFADVGISQCLRPLAVRIDAAKADGNQAKPALESEERVLPSRTHFEEFEASNAAVTRRARWYIKTCG